MSYISQYALHSCAVVSYISQNALHRAPLCLALARDGGSADGDRLCAQRRRARHQPPARVDEAQEGHCTRHCLNLIKEIYST